MTFKIDKDVPAPRGARESKFPFKEMKVGDSFFAEDHTVHQLSGNCVSQGKRLNMKFTCRTVTENGKKGVRVWRVK